MNDDPAARNKPAEPQGAVGVLRRHLLAYAAANGVFFLIDLLTPGPWWFFWPMFGWGIAIAMHWLYVKSVNIDDGWAEERTKDIRQKAYDAGHIEDIEKRYEARSRGRSPMKRHDQTVGRQ